MPRSPVYSHCFTLHHCLPSAAHSHLAAAAAATTAHSSMSESLELLKQQAEAQMRRPAPPLSGQEAKKRKLDNEEQKNGGGDAAAAAAAEGGGVARFAYAADTAIAAGSTCLSASCGFNRQRSAAKEMLTIVKPLLPDGTQLQMVKVGCRGLAVVRVEPPPGAPPVPVTAIVGQVLDKIESGELKRTKFCERICPAETTCLLTASALEAALTRVVTSFLAPHKPQQQQEGGEDAAPQQPPLEYAVVYKSRGVDPQILAELEQEEAARQQEAEKKEQTAAQDTADKQPAPALPPPQQQQHVTDTTKQPQGLDRQRVYDLAAAVMQQCCKDTCGCGIKVNLKSPQVMLVVEVLPLLQQTTACTVAAIPQSMMSSSRKLKIRPTGTDAALHMELAGKGGGGKKGGGGAGKKGGKQQQQQQQKKGGRQQQQQVGQQAKEGQQ